MMAPTTVAVILSLLTSSALAGPLAFHTRQSTTCNAKPSGSSSAAAISTPSASTAEACQQQCEANSQCQSFVFGLPSGGSSPVCMLFAVEGAQVPSQDSNLMVFDKGCSGVPTGTPTTSDPVGDNNSNTNGSGQQQQQQSNGGQRKGVSKRQGGQNPAGNNNNGNANIGAGTGNTNTGSGAGNTNTGSDAGNTNTGSGTGNTNGNTNTGNTGSTSQVCGAAPSGSSTNNPTPMKTDTSITTQDACLQLCKNTNGCQSAEFGKASSSGSNECRLFSVAASQLPQNGSGATFVASDVGC